MIKKGLLFLLLLITIFNFLLDAQLINADSLSLAEDYASHVWKAKKENVNHSLYKDIGRKSVFTAEQQVIGVAYSWGGSDTISQFDKRIGNNEPAGLIYSEDSNGKELTWEKYHKFAGIDCSGFVNNLWGISKKNTYQLLDCFLPRNMTENFLQFLSA